MRPRAFFCAVLFASALVAPALRAADPLDPRGLPGPLVIAGGNVPADARKAFFDLAGKGKAKIVVIGSDPKAVEPWEQLKPLSVEFVHAADHKAAGDPKLAKPLAEATAVWLEGTDAEPFAKVYGGTPVEAELKKLHARGGAIGGSAGASIQSDYMPRGHPLGNAVMAAEGYERGFGYLPGCAVDQHFFARKRTADMTGLMKEYPQYLGIGLDEGTAIVVTGGTAEVVGKSKVAFYDTTKKPDGEKDYEEVFPNEKYDLKERRKIK